MLHRFHSIFVSLSFDETLSFENVVFDRRKDIFARNIDFSRTLDSVADTALAVARVSL